MERQNDSPLVPSMLEAGVTLNVTSLVTVSIDGGRHRHPRINDVIFDSSLF